MQNVRTVIDVRVRDTNSYGYAFSKTRNFIIKKEGNSEVENNAKQDCEEFN
jgi:hypothetical protein